MKVFIVDDSPYMREFLLDEMSALKGIEVAGQAKDALDATPAIRSVRPDVLILDLVLVRGSGLGVLGVIKKEFPTMKVIVLSGYGDLAARETCARLGADFFLEKPGGLKALPKLLENLRREIDGPGA
jgi:DNA-binding NarL/FixJ family response regulator